MRKRPEHALAEVPASLRMQVDPEALARENERRIARVRFTPQRYILGELSVALGARAASARNRVVAIRTGRRYLTGTVWQADTIVASEQSLPKANTFDVVVPEGAAVKATVQGRDAATNIAVLRLDAPVQSAPSVVPAEAVAGMLALAYGADGAGGATARLGVANAVGGEWFSSAGGRIDRRIVLDVRLFSSEEGGPVLDAAGACLGITTFGPVGQVLVIPTTTIDRVVPLLLSDGRVARGWLGVAMQTVAIPDSLQSHSGEASGLMVMSLIADGPAAKSGVLAGDIVVAVNGAATPRIRSLARELGPESIGRTTELRVIRGGAVVAIDTTIEAARP